ncbi:hypothetical protein, conserved [Babesia bigemina]|uniref:Uncharacterized protein n=1 Tax=Babesia bigemina TaxID=5866 RepID=A0A061DCX6_BABBI|nr:hypothetical protein, conserved [Babesia bigemina]CDR98067.1 hypothetical protein, conserved [Babesia bigemina]|eukprot:XP_012770253.1 hypothetical protein, conserved [Babesia bigemina]
MPLSYCCHIIASIELRYASDTRIPKKILRAFKYPRIEDHDEAPGSSSGEFLASPATWMDDVDVCNSILQSHGYSIGGGALSIRKLDSNAGQPIKRLRNQPSRGEPTSGQTPITENGNIDGAVMSYICGIVRRSMVYHLCLYDDYSKDFEHIVSKPSDVTRDICSIRKHSAYEMLCSLRDCLTQLRSRSTDTMEAVLVTDEYSGIFTNEEIIITRSTIGFRNMLADEGIKFYNLYDPASSSSGNLLALENWGNCLDNLVNDYLQMSTTKDREDNQEPKSDELAIVPVSDGAPFVESTLPAKDAFFKALNLPVSDHDINVLTVKGRAHCRKLLKFLDRLCKSALLKLKSARLHCAPVKIVLSNFPVIFSKLQELRISSDEMEDGVANEHNSLSIRGLILPGVLNGIFKVVRRMQTQGTIQDVSITLTYNTDMDAELHESMLQISEKNRIYNNFMANVNSLESTSQRIYRTLRKLVPFTNFVVHKGRISVPYKGALRDHGHIELSHPDNVPKLESRTLYLTDASLSQEHMRPMPAESEQSCDKVVVLKDTLYANLAMVKFTMEHLEGAHTVSVIPTKSLIDEVLSYVPCISASSEKDNSRFTKCYVDLYPILNNDNVHATMDIQPYHLVNLAWLMGYLLHRGGFLPFIDRESCNESAAMQTLDSDLLYSSLSLSRSLSEEFSVFLDGSVPEMFKTDVSPMAGDPLAQQSYIIKLVHHVTFNKRFQNLLGMSYHEHARRKLEGMPSLDVKRKVSNDTISLISRDTSEGYTAVLTHSWNTLLRRAQSESITTDSGKEHDDRNSGTEDLPTSLNSSHNTDVITLDKIPEQPWQTQTSAGNLLNMLSATADGAVKRNLLRTESYQSVSSVTRAHGRVRHCVFDFDTKASLKHKSDRSKLQQEIHKTYRPDHVQGERSGSNRHLVFVLLTNDAVSSLASSRIKLVKDVINSSDVMFLHGENAEESEQPIEYNAFNAQNVERRYKLESTAAVAEDYYIKGGMSYSFSLGVSRLLPHLARLHKKVSFKHRSFKSFCNIELYYVRMDSGTSPRESLSVHSLIAPDRGTARSIFPGRVIVEQFVSYAWLCDVYFDGCIDLRAEIRQCQKMSTAGESMIDHYFSRDDAEQHRKSSHRSLTFSGPYRDVKFLWGWSIYMLDRKNVAVSDDDALLFKMHCGICIRVHRSLNDIAKEVKNDLGSRLKRFNIDESDVSAFFFHPRIYTNSLVLLDDATLRSSDLEHLKKNPFYANGCVRETFGGFPICFGRYEGLPLLSLRWLKDTLQNGRPEPIAKYLLLS